ncbi:MAG: ABC transporter substrate-binding protein [Synergistaceae bacterium]|jgi:ABC-type nitrate/sulfonate/bicarbonate transport system substrate-binding protein|nr:ABC transporter substrate-binding protein [Synergistaceae bacterium]
MRISFKKSFIAAITGIALLVAADSRPAGGADLFLIRSSAQTVFNEFHVADLLGFYEEEGLKIEFLGLVEGLNKYQMLGQGLIDVADGHPDQVAKARLAGIKVKAVVPGMVDHPDYPHVRYIARENGPIKSLDDIVGKKVAIGNYGSCYEGYLKTHLDRKGIKGDVEWVVLARGGQAEQSLTQGLIDLTTSHPPFGSLAIQAGGNRQIATSWDIFKSSAAGLSVRAFSEDFIREHPDKLRAFARAMYKARKWIDAHMDEAVPLVSKALGHDPEKVSVEWDGRWYAETPGFVKEDIELWFELSEALGYWEHGDIAPEEIYTNEFAPGQ